MWDFLTGKNGGDMEITGGYMNIIYWEKWGISA
jgi:hypothetical protein